ncbi:MAG: hypothetical protein RMK57_08165 [Bryobacterales bacterium]|nr:hypothetical protein [Bryobacteraceae bacterium]MDW8354490.1 hypothetical protein [Bryobacterales bacterium]
MLTLAASLTAEYRLWVCGRVQKYWVAGLPLSAGGLFVESGAADFEHRGFHHPYVMALDYDRRDPATLYLAAGNGLIRAANAGRQWRILTDHQVTELRDLSVDPNAPGTIYFAYVNGLQVTRDGGTTFAEVHPLPRRRYTESVRVDRTRAGRLVCGGESGLYWSEDGGRNWRLAGAAGFQILYIEQSPHDADHWLAVTQRGGLFVSTDGGRTFENSGNVGVGRNLYDIAFDPGQVGRIALCGYRVGVVVSEDNGQTWQERNHGLPSPNVSSVTFDPDRPGRLLASVHQEGLYVSEDAGRSWRRYGLDGSVVYRLRFVPEAAR